MLEKNDDVIVVDSKEAISIEEICNRYDLGNYYVRKVMREKLLPSFKEYKEGTKILKSYAFVEDVETWRNNLKVVGREDGRNKYTIYLNEEELESISTKLLEVFNEEEVENLFFRTNKKNK